jgi:hypothetical protein
VTIKQQDCNKAKATLVKAGSKTAEKSHQKHNAKEGIPDDHGVQLLQEARDEFRKADKTQPGLKAGMTVEHWTAVTAAAKAMGITKW